MITIVSDFYDSLEATLTHMKNIKLGYFPIEYISEWCESTVSDTNRLDSAV